MDAKDFCTQWTQRASHSRGASGASWTLGRGGEAVLLTNGERKKGNGEEGQWNPCWGERNSSLY